MFTAGIPAFIISVIGFFVLGMSATGNSYDASVVNEILTAITSNFRIGFVTFIPLIVIIVLLIRKIPATSAILCGSVVGILVLVFYQGCDIAQVGNYLSGGFKISTGSSYLDPILNRGGITSMLNLIATVVASLGMGGILKDCGTMDVLVEALNKSIKTRFTGTTYNN